MLRRRRYGRPNRFDLLLMMLANGALGAVVLYAVCALFNVQPILDSQYAAHGLSAPSRWAFVGPLVPGAAVAFGCLWYWLILTGRRRGLAWGGAMLYGAIIACANVPVGGLVTGALQGEPLLGMLIGLVLLLLMPSLLLAMVMAGLLLGGFNGWMAQAWIATTGGK